MSFKSWAFKDPLYVNKFGILEPKNSKEKIIPEFEMKGKTQAQQDEEARIKKEADDLAAKAKTESELVELEEKEISKLDSMEEEEEDMK